MTAPQWREEPAIDDSWSPVPVRRIQSNGRKAIVPDPEPGPAELLFAAYVFAGMALWLAWARWRLW